MPAPDLPEGLDPHNLPAAAHFREAMETGLVDRAKWLRLALDQLYAQMLFGEVSVAETNRRLIEATRALIGYDPDADAGDPHAVCDPRPPHDPAAG